MPQITDTVWTAVTSHPDTELESPCLPGSIADFESSFGLRLPPGYHEFLQRANGGAVGDVRLCGVSRPDALDLAAIIERMRPHIQAQADGPILPFASTWGGSYYCFDLAASNNDGEFPILYWEHEYSEEPADRPLLWSRFAPDFVTFIQRVLE